MDFLPANPYQQLPMDMGYGNTANLIAPPMPQQPMQETQSPIGMGGFMPSIQNFIAPYQQMAQKMYSPYALFQPGSAFPQNHPMAAGILNNMFLNAAMTPSGRTIGENISGVAQGIIGAQQFQRQRQLESLMLPYQLAEPQFKMATQLGQLQRDQAYWNYIMGGRIPYMQQQGALAEGRLNALGAPKATNRMQVAEDGTPYQEVMSNGQLQMINAITGDLAPRGTKFQPTGSTTGQPTEFKTELAVVQQQHPDWSPAQIGQAALDLHNRNIAAQAGGSAGARQGATQPQLDVTQEAKEARSQFQARKPLTENDFLIGHPPQYKVTDYAKYKSDFEDAEDQRRASYNARIDAYLRDARKVPMDWAQWNMLQGSGGPSQGGPSPSQTPRNAPAAPAAATAANRPPGW